MVINMKCYVKKLIVRLLILFVIVVAMLYSGEFILNKSITQNKWYHEMML